MKKKKGFILYADYQKHILQLSNAEVGKLFKAVFAYVNGEEFEVQLTSAGSMAFSFIKEQIERDREKWELTCQRRSEAGKKGGAPKGNQNAAKRRGESKTTKNKQKQAKQPDTENDTVTDTDIVSVTEEKQRTDRHRHAVPPPTGRNCMTLRKRKSFRGMRSTSIWFKSLFFQACAHAFRKKDWNSFGFCAILKGYSKKIRSLEQ